MNHGRCKNCWWWKEYYPYYGKCYMHISDTEQYIVTGENNYCPDYFNRKKDKEHSLDEFIKKIEKQI